MTRFLQARIHQVLCFALFLGACFVTTTVPPQDGGPRADGGASLDGGVPPGVYTLEPVAPSGATNFACDLPVLPILPNTVTQVDYEMDTSRNRE